MPTLPTTYLDFLEYQLAELEKNGMHDPILEHEIWKQKRFQELAEQLAKLEAESKKNIVEVEHDHDYDFQERNHQEERNLSNYEEKMYADR